jgi:hypothetical protein
MLAARTYALLALVAAMGAGTVITARETETAPQAKPATKSTAKPAPAPAAPSRTERRVPFLVGEQLIYDVSWSSYVSAGTLALKVEGKRPSLASTAYYVSAEAQTTGLLSKLYTLYYKADSLIDVFTLLPQRGSVYSRENRDERLKTTTFDHAKKTAVFEMKTASLMHLDLQLPPLTQDLLSAIYVLRSIQPRTGDRLEIPVSDSGKLYKVTFIVGGVEPQKKSDGTAVQALRVTPEIRDEKGKPAAAGSVLWLANNPSLTPVRMEASLPVGRVVVALR